MRIQNIIPPFLRKKILNFHQNFIWNNTFNEFKSDIENKRKPSRKLLKKLIYAWGNQGFSAQVDYLETCIEYGLNTSGNIIECGSGLSTLVLGVIAKSNNKKMISFEHIDFWAKKIQNRLNDNNLINNQIYIRGLKNYGEFEWYNLDNIELPSFSLCICDAPPSNTLGGRRGFMYLLKDKLDDNAVILVDDTIREDEQLMISEWRTITNFDIQFKGSFDPHGIITMK